MSALTLDVGEWAEENFGGCELGDVRRTRRAVTVTVTRQMAEHPDGSTPDQAEDWSDLKAMYRLFDADEATFTALATPHWQLPIGNSPLATPHWQLPIGNSPLATPHWQRTRTLARGTVLLIGDTVLLTWGRDRLRHPSGCRRAEADGGWVWARLLPAQFDDGRCGQR
ncbi:MAG: transposase [Planctomycetales bacterium]|nr:transposase [Planctomycetales bacterium]